jgi:hypothetical protein
VKLIENINFMMTERAETCSTHFKCSVYMLNIVLSETNTAVTNFQGLKKSIKELSK